MPRPKPDMNKLLQKYIYSKGYTLLEIPNEETFNNNTLFKVLCKHNKEHIFTVNITELKRNKINIDSECPHCRKKEKYKKKGMAFESVKHWFIDNNLTVINIKDYYNRWSNDESIIFKCNKCGNTDIIKSIGYFEKNTVKNDKKYICLKCEKNSLGLIEKKEFLKIVKNIKHDFGTDPVELSPPIFNREISDNLLIKFKKSKWHIVVYNGTRIKGLFKCIKCGALKKVTPHSLFIGKGGGCKGCRNLINKNNIYDKLKIQCKNSNCYPLESEIYKGPYEPIKFKCNNCGAEFERKWYYMNSEDGSNSLFCPNCYKSTKRKSQTVLTNWIKSIYKGEILSEVNNIIKPKELDIYLPNLNLAIEYCGNIWHSTKYKNNNNYHKNKMNECNDKNIRLLTIFEDEWLDKTEICKSRIFNSLGITKNKIYARKCQCKIIDNKEALKFCENNHIQGRGQANISYGMFFNHELVSVMTFSKPSISKNFKNYDWELNRFCSKINFVVVGSASKLFKHFIRSDKTGIIVSFCDLRWGTGNVYEKLGMKLTGITRPNYYYVGKDTQYKRKHRFNFTKHKLLEKYGGSSKSTEKELAENNNLHRIYDCGHLRFEYVI